MVQFTWVFTVAGLRNSFSALLRPSQASASTTVMVPVMNG